MSSAISIYLKKRASWNPKRTVAKISIFETPAHFLYPNELIESNDVATEDPQIIVNDVAFEPSAGGLTCRACSLVFASLLEQRSHFKSSIHNFNLQRRLLGLSPLDAGAFESISLGADSSSFELLSSAEAVPATDSLGPGSGSEDEEHSSGEGGPELIDFAALAQSQDADASNASAQALYGCTAEGEYRRSFSGTEGPICSFCPSHQKDWEFSLSEALLVSPSSSQPAVGGASGSGSGSGSGSWAGTGAGGERDEDTNTQSTPWSNLRATLQLLHTGSRLWAVLLLRSGKFAGAVFDGEKVLAHKVFRRYTIRAKSGGSQSSHDNQHGKAMSAGAMMRRQGEVMLKEDVSRLLREWQAHLQTCFTVLISCPKTMRNVFFEDNVRDPPLRKEDKRIRNIPFMVAVPTYEEVIRVRDRCSTLTFKPYSGLTCGADVVDTATLPAAEATVVFSQQSLDMNGLPAAATVSATVSDEEVDEAEVELGGEAVVAARVENKKVSVATAQAVDLPHCEASVRLFSACRGGDVGAVQQLLQGLELGLSSPDATPSTAGGVASPVSPSALDWDLEEVVNLPGSVEMMETPLHVASDLGYAAIVALLLEAGADPGRIDVRGRLPYLMCKDKACRDVYRKHRAVAEEAWDWDAAGVPAALTDEAIRAQKEKEKKKKAKAKAKKKDEKQREEEDRERKVKEQEELELQRVRDASLAAERALVSAGVCASCNASLFKVLALDVLGHRCCSSNCVVRLRRKLAADAALQRIQSKGK